MVEAAAAINKENIRSMVYSLDSYPKLNSFLESVDEDVPEPSRSSGLPKYKQKAEEINDASVFMISLVLIKLVSNDQILWQNPRTLSTQFSRPIRFQITKETTEVSATEKEYVEARVRTLTNTKLHVCEIDFEISHTLLFTMVDDQVCNAVTGTTSTQKCYICKLSSKVLKTFKKVGAAPLNRSTYQFGLFSLQGWIRRFQFLLHLLYKLPLKTWQARRKEAKGIVSQ
ncbi:hypothetical protein ILUMI_14410 [Ignelater luminosus]|uniref:Uncharacterized protein n=1 Tax=Ignelater luminosus TaxID=2038154 RepID=A0A8K0GAY9_IGNLU|nr:hypothetical protein ILUMI_14410 [Ignelater luminosus]